jgi:hypothetical protein
MFLQQNFSLKMLSQPNCGGLCCKIYMSRLIHLKIVEDSEFVIVTVVMNNLSWKFFTWICRGSREGLKKLWGDDWSLLFAMRGKFK